MSSTQITPQPMTNASDSMRLRFASSAHDCSSFSTSSRRFWPWCSAALSADRFVNHSTGNTTRASAYCPAATWGTVYVTVPSAFTVTLPSSGPWPQARTFSPGTTSVPCGTGSASVMVTLSESSCHCEPMYCQYTSPTSLYACAPFSTV